MTTSIDLAQFRTLLENGLLCVRGTDNTLLGSRWQTEITAQFHSGERFIVNVDGNFREADTLIQQNLRKQFAESSNFKELLQLVPFSRYTLFLESDFGIGCRQIQLSFHSVRVGTYAQFDDAVQFIFRPKRCRDYRAMTFYGNKSFAIWNGWVKIDTEAFSTVSDDGSVIVQKSKYRSFDERYFTDALKTAPSVPLFSKLFSLTNSEVSHG